MKKAIALALLLLALCAAAQAEEYPGHTLKYFPILDLQLLSDQSFVGNCWEDASGDTARPHHLAWWQDGQVIRDMPYATGGAVGDLLTAQFLVNPDGSFKVLVKHRNPDSDGFSTDYDRCFLFDWTDKGLDNTIELPVGLTGMAAWANRVEAYGNHAVLTTHSEKEPCALTVYDTDGQAVARAALPLSSRVHPVQFAEISDGVFLAEMSFLDGNGPTAGYQYCLVCFDQGGLRWQKSLAQAVSLWPDHQGGAIISQSVTDEAYTPFIITRLDGNGKVIAQKTLSGKNVVLWLGPNTYDVDKRAYAFYGGAVANSRRVYTVYRLITDEALIPLSWDVRDLSQKYRDYSPNLLLSPQGTPFVWTREMRSDGHGESALVPFDHLPASSADVGLELE
ncbi:MAG: hypothetical protein IJ189_13360 [Clostridia bacterium]|nr:hypothetical protein [Clostridia bacterium]